MTGGLPVLVVNRRRPTCGEKVGCRFLHLAAINACRNLMGTYDAPGHATAPPALIRKNLTATERLGITGESGLSAGLHRAFFHAGYPG